MLKELGWQDLKQHHKELCLTLFYKIVHGLMVVLVDDPCVLVPADTRTPANHPYKYRAIPAETSQFWNSFFVQTMPEWNQFAEDAVVNETVATFKSKIKTV